MEIKIDFTLSSENENIRPDFYYPLPLTILVFGQQIPNQLALVGLKTFKYFWKYFRKNLHNSSLSPFIGVLEIKIQEISLRRMGFILLTRPSIYLNILSIQTNILMLLFICLFIHSTFSQDVVDIYPVNLNSKGWIQFGWKKAE
jgi:hypothetical protein